MSRQVGPERAHFGGKNGLITETSNHVTRYYWRCIHCGYELGGKNFQNAKARIHLSGDPGLRNGTIANLCAKAPEKVQQQFALLERQKRVEKEQKAAQRKRAAELMCATPSPVHKRKRSTQRTLSFHNNNSMDEDVDLAWGKAFFGLDIAPAKISHPLFREAIYATQKSSLW